LTIGSDTARRSSQIFVCATVTGCNRNHDTERQPGVATQR
jgi:hypothetical protein